MSEFGNLSPQDQAKVDGKLGELREKTDRVWSCEVTKTPEGRESATLLEISVDGQIARPIVLDRNTVEPADRICSELERFYQSRPELQPSAAR